MKKHVVEEKIEKAISDYNMSDLFGGCLIGLSGGSDSSALLYYFAHRCENITAVHINHMIRGSEADRDENFCRELCKNLGVNFVSYKINIPALAKEKRQGLEQTAREERYRVFGEETKKNPLLKYILTAHNADDNAETVLFNLARGCGLNGLCGINAVNGNILRPLIYCEKAEIEDYCKENKIEYVTDSTNFDTDYTRNYIRHKIIPKMKEINRSFDASVIKMGKIVKEDDGYINSVAEKIISENKITDKAPTELLLSLDGSLVKRILKKMSGENLSYASLESCIDLIKYANCGKIINLEDGLSLKKEHNYIHFIKTIETEHKKYDIALTKGINLIAQTDIALVWNSEEEPTGYTKIYEAELDSTFSDKKMCARSRIDGDTVKQGKMTKKLKKIFCDNHIPSHKRDFYPIIYDENGIVLVPCLVSRDGATTKSGGIKIAMFKKNK